MATSGPMVKEKEQVKLPDTVEGIYAEYGERIAQVISLFTDKNLSDKIIPEPLLRAIGERLANQPRNKN